MTSITEALGARNYAEDEKSPAIDDRFGGDAMVLTIVAFCAAGAVLLFGLGVYAEFQELRTHPGHRFDDGDSHPKKPMSK